MPEKIILYALINIAKYKAREDAVKCFYFSVDSVEGIPGVDERLTYFGSNVSSMGSFKDGMECTPGRSLWMGEECSYLGKRDLP